jgi:hypothetical protein
VLLTTWALETPIAFVDDKNPEPIPDAVVYDLCFEPSDLKMLFMTSALNMIRVLDCYCCR